MILPKKPGVRHSGFNGMEAANPVPKGKFMYNAGAFNTGTHAALGTPGFASSGDAPRMLLATATLSGNGVFPVNKLILAKEGADQALDTIASGASLIFYEGGEYETDEYDITVSGTGSVSGSPLYINATGQITLTAGANTMVGPVGEVVAVSAAPASSDWWTGGTAGAQKATVWYRLYASHSGPNGVFQP